MLSMTFAGRIGRDAELRRTNAGKSVAGFPVAVDVGFGDNKKTQWIDCSLWGERGEKLAQYLTKGSNVTIQGRPEVRAYQKDGETRAALQCFVNELTLQGGGQKQDQSPQQQPQQSGGGWDDLDDTVPF